MIMDPSSSADDKDKPEPETALDDDKRDMAPASGTPINDDDDDKTEPVPEQLTSGEPDAKCEEDSAREPADLSTKSKKEALPFQRPFRLDPEDVARFSRDPVEWMKTFRVPVDQKKSREPDDKGHLKPVDYTTTLNNNSNNNNNNNIVQQLLGQQLLGQQLLGQQLLGNRNSIDDNNDAAAATKKKRSRSKKQRRSGSDVTASDPATTIGVVATSGVVLTPSGGAVGLVTPSSGVVVDPNSPPVVLDVVCGQNQASLSLEKLKSGSKTACVQLNGSWLTPNQYQHVSGRGTARDWKRSIKHNGTSLKALLASKVLTFDPPLCRCNLCHAISSSNSSNSSISSSNAKETSSSSGAIAARSSETTRIDQENEPPSPPLPPPPPPSLAPPRGVERPPSAMAVASGGATSPHPLARTSKAAAPTIVCGARDSTDDDDEEEEEEEEEEDGEVEEENGEKEDDDEETVEELEEEMVEEEEDWEKKRALMDVLSLKQLPTTTWRSRPSVDDAKQPSRKRKAPLNHHHHQGDGGGGGGVRAKKKKVRNDGRKEKRGSQGSGSGWSSPHLLGGKSNHGGSEKVRRNSENDAVGGASSLGSSDWTALDTSGPSGDLCRRVLSAATGATSSSLGAEAFNAMQQRVNGGELGTPSLQKEETLTHIIHELRNYKKSLEEKIVASRRTSHVTPPKEPISASGSHNSPHLQWSSASGGKDGLPATFQRRTSGCSDKAKSVDAAARTSTSQDGCGRRDWSVKGATKLDGSDEKQLPDLVRSHNPSTITTTTSSPAAGSLATTTPKTPCTVYPSFTPSPLTSTHYHNNPVGRYVIDPQTGARYDCDEQGVIDLSVGKKHPTASNLLARPIYSTLMGKMEFDGDADSDCERVLDLSVTSKVKVEQHRTTPRAAPHPPNDEQRVQKRKRLSDGHSRRGSTSAAAASVQKQRPPHPHPHPPSTPSSFPWTLSPGKILGWTVTDVSKFVADVPECGIYAETFKQFGVTGPSLVCLSVDQMTAILRMRLNAAQSLRSAIDRIVAAAAAAVASA